jgi:pilus assembly protein CpaF
MRSTGFGRRVAEPSGPKLLLVPSPSRGPAEELPGRGELKEQIRTVLMSRIDPSVAGRISRMTLEAEVAKLVSEIATEQRVQLNEAEQITIAAELTDDMVGLGPVEPFLDDDDVTDILVNGPFDIYIERGGKLEKTNARFRDAQHLVNIAQRIASAIGRRIDEASPMVDARLADGSRVNIVLPPLVLNGGTISIRKFPKRHLTLDRMVRQENLSREMARLLQIAARSRLNILISGGTGSGKTTLLNAVSQFIDRDERVITIEDAVELRLQQPHVVQMETRPPNIEGVGYVPQRELVRNALRMRPDRIIVGEVRGAETFDMLQAMNTGHDGSMSTVHANSPRDALYRLENMVIMANLNLPLRAIRMHVASALNLVVHIERMRDGIRRVQNICEMAGMEGETITMRELFTFQFRGERRDGTIDGEFVSSRMRPDFMARAAQFNLDRELLDAMEIAGGRG